MNYRFYYPEWNNRKEVCKEYPQIKEITREPTAFWYGVGPKRTIRKTKKSIERLLKNFIDADSLHYLSKQGMLDNKYLREGGFCTYCFDGEEVIKRE